MRLRRLGLGLMLLGTGALLLRARKDDVKHLVVEQVLERPARDKRYAELADELEVAGERVLVRARRAKELERAKETMRHIIGIERWGQRRLEAALGEAFSRDEHHPYKPPADATWNDVLEDFTTTRQRTVSLARELSSNPPDPAWRVEHNGLGPLSARGWLRYLMTHAGLESRRMR
ncbi:DinB family protein [Deinococcus yavapaiensis]|uniref:DinB family protein n=1 Tax=Deinococcus yavapaiensis KR-236 TaxID=694435 RepID=A0A318S3D6_9DEIO|nr:DinB family protein [Deinococcus yavapaiensis]PYE51945.1 hypothetical protein DES52_114146 [Deinococcus yavapaiensis KR-236]